MQSFIYQALDIQGQKVCGRIFAATKKDVVVHLRKQHLQPIRITVKKSFLKLSQAWVGGWAKDMAFFLHEGLSLIESLHISKTRLNIRQKHQIDLIIEALHAGNALSVALQQQENFPSLLSALLGVGEATGRYAEAFADFAVIEKEKRDFIKNLWGSLQYPLILCVVMIVMLMGFSEFLLPSFLDFFSQNQLVLSQGTALFIQFANFINKSLDSVFSLYGMGVFASALFAMLYITPLRLFLSYVTVHIPVFGSIYLESLQYLYLKTFVTLLKRGHHIVQAALHSQDVIQNMYLKKCVKKIPDAITTNGKLAEAFAKYLWLKPSYANLLKTGEKTARLIEYADICSATIKRQNQESIKKILLWTGPTLVTIIGVGILFMVITIVLPVYEQITKLD